MEPIFPQWHKVFPLVPLCDTRQRTPWWSQRGTGARSLARPTDGLLVAHRSTFRAHRVGGGNAHRPSLRHPHRAWELFTPVVRRPEWTHGAAREWKIMENDAKMKMKERFGLRRDIFKEFLAEFLGIFVLIVSTSLCTCHSAWTAAFKLPTTMLMSCQRGSPGTLLSLTCLY